MTKDEALKLALEALKEDRAWLETDAPTEVWEKNNEAITAIKAALEAKDGCQCPACKVAPHASDCAVHNEPAYPAGECNCGANGEPAAWMYPDDLKRFETSEAYAEAYSIAMVSPTQGETVPLYRAPQKQPPVIDKSVARRIATQLGWEPPRTWVGLTDEEIVLIVAECAASHQHTDIHFARAIEAKLRSKND